MINRYTLPKVGKLWTEIPKKTEWHNVELAALWAQEQLGFIPAGTYELAKEVGISKKIIKRAHEIEKVKDHDLISFILAVTEELDEQAKRFYHAGLTSFDTEDTALALILKKSVNIILNKLKRLKSVIKHRADEHRNTIMIGRSHFIHGEPITFGVKLLNWFDVIERHINFLQYVRDEIAVGKISGAMGVYVLDPRIEELACQHLGLRPAKISTQILSRDLLLRYTNALIAVANSIDRFATEIRHLAGTDIGEVAEFKKPGASGSSAMPGKSLLRNPIKSENVCGLAKIMRGYVIPAMECEISWNEVLIIQLQKESTCLMLLYS